MNVLTLFFRSFDFFLRSESPNQFTSVFCTFRYQTKFIGSTIRITSFLIGSSCIYSKSWNICCSPFAYI